VLFYNEAIELAAYPVIQINREMQLKLFLQEQAKLNVAQNRLQYSGFNTCSPTVNCYVIMGKPLLA